MQRRNVGKLSIFLAFSPYIVRKIICHAENLKIEEKAENRIDNSTVSRTSTVLGNETTILIGGYGISGREATKYILKNKPNNSKLIIIDEKITDRIDKVNNVEYVQGKIIEVNANEKYMRLLEGKQVYFEKCLLSMGRSKPSNSFYENYIDKEAKHVYYYTDSNTNQQLQRILFKGGHVTLIGSDWRAVLYASKIAMEAKKSGYRNNVSLIFSDFLMTNQLPKYLSTSLQKKLKTKFNIEMIPMTQVQYVGGPHSVPDNLKRADKTDIAIYAGGTFDTLASIIFGTNGVVFFKDELATLSIKTDLEKDNYGAIPVNLSLAATRSVFVAGDVANIYSASVGRGMYTGYNHSRDTARVAAVNLLGQEKDVLYTDVPVFELNIEEAGVHMAFVGNCSSALHSYGYWWKHPIQRKQSEEFRPTPVESSSSVHKYIPGLFQNNRAKKHLKETVHLGNANTVKATSQEDSTVMTSKILYGNGLVFYLNNDIVCGVLVNGISHYLSQNAKEKLLNEVKALIGRPASPEHSEVPLGDQYLRYNYLLDFSTRVLRTAAADNDALRDKVSGPPSFNYCTASKAALRSSAVLSNNIQAISPSVAVDNSFATGNSTISSTELTSNAYRKGINNRSITFR